MVSVVFNKYTTATIGPALLADDEEYTNFLMQVIGQPFTIEQARRESIRAPHFVFVRSQQAAELRNLLIENDQLDNILMNRDIHAGPFSRVVKMTIDAVNAQTEGPRFRDMRIVGFEAWNGLVDFAFSEGKHADREAIEARLKTYYIKPLISQASYEKRPAFLWF